MPERDTHRLRAVADDRILADELDFAAARAKHRELTQAHIAHFWEVYKGPRTGWNVVSGLLEGRQCGALLPDDAILEDVV